MKIIIFNKPYDVLSQFREDSKHLTLSHFIHDPELRLAGRLDLDSEGLMFLTDHGGLNQFITNPKNKSLKAIWHKLMAILQKKLSSSYVKGSNWQMA